MNPGILYIVPTPIGNLEDITYRAIKILSSVDLILCEDTRRTKILCDHYEIKVPLKSYYSYIESRRVKEIVPYIKEGHKVALVSDSGTPGISDPGFVIIRECINEGIKIVSLPGPVAYVTAVVASGLPLNKILFLGFLPRKVGQLKKCFEGIKIDEVTIVFYESPMRILKTLEILLTIFPEETQCVVAREITKMYEEFLRGKLKEVSQQLKSRTVKGELVVILYS